MYQWKNNAKVILPLALSVSISNALYSGAAFAKDYTLNYIGKDPELPGISIKDTIAGDNNYDFTVKIDNPVRGEGNGLEVKIGNITSDQGGEYHIGNYNVNISGTTEQEHRAGLAFFGLSAEGSDTKVTVDNFSLKNNFLIGNKYTHNNTALYVGGGADVSVNGNVYIRSEVEHTKQGEDATLANNGVYARGAGSTITANGGDVYINTYASNFKELLENNSGYPEGSSKSDAVSAKDGGVVNINQAGGNKVNLLGNLDFGDKLYSNTSQMNITLNGADSYWHGHEANFFDATTGKWSGDLNLTLANNAHWIPDGKDAEISAITLKDGGTVNLHGFNLHTNQSINETVKIHDLKGNNGIFLIDVNTNKTDEQRRNGSDFIEVVKSSTGGTHAIEALNINKLTDLKEDIWVADAASNVTFEAYDKVDITNEYVYDYKPLLRSDIREGDPQSQYGTNWYITGVSTKASAGSNTVIANAGLNYAMATARLEIDSLNKRLGELRQDQQQNGLWIRYKGGEIESDTGSYFKNLYSFWQLGYDNKDEGESSVWTRGIAAHYMRGNADFTYGTGDNKNYGGSLYAAWNRPEKQDYLDLVLKYSRHESDFNYRNTYGNSGFADSSTWSISASAEYGREFSLGNSTFIEPQGQIVYTYLDEASYTTSSGLKVRQNDIDSVIGRVGLRGGYRFESRPDSDIYVKLDLLHEFAGDRDVTVWGKDAALKVSEGGSDSWINYGIGTNIHLTQNNNSRLYVDLERSAGGDIDMNWQVNAGFRMEW
ncbi:autotransporter outer membrane beta-barrel domain-containing protein [Citrobacter freundii]|uniref:autotransporter outer membrane beta-barrel domain-containing protein n=1 Tax=Citrobacter freundii TaxID=546 RepID=UPI001093E2E1|nr:autotransporter outer membrane beta-barrel domain-containing protein [Citrobacter freundii]QCA20276.1 autotransporter outer membrane beta-barrel domain-containing protein [Citrobacter freundii]